jgi:hypothetical protein
MGSSVLQADSAALSARARPDLKLFRKDFFTLFFLTHPPWRDFAMGFFRVCGTSRGLLPTTEPPAWLCGIPLAKKKRQRTT